MSSGGDPESVDVRLTRLETYIGWLKEAVGRIERRLDTLENRLWWIFGSVVVFGIISILLALVR